MKVVHRAELFNLIDRWNYIEMGENQYKLQNNQNRMSSYLAMCLKPSASMVQMLTLETKCISVRYYYYICVCQQIQCAREKIV